jgi:hypothetical protein
MLHSFVVGWWLLLGSNVCNVADMLALLEDDEDSNGKECVRVTGAVDQESAGVTAGLLHFLLCSPLALPDSSDDKQHDGGRSGDSVLPVWVDTMDRYLCRLVLPCAVRDRDQLAWVWQGIPHGWEDRDGDDDNEA